MAGLFGFLMRRPAARGEIEARLRAMQHAMVRRPHHRAVTVVEDAAGLGASGPGILPASLTPLRQADGTVVFAEGEIYDADLGADLAGRWAEVAARWRDRGASAFADLDGLYNVVRFDPRGASGPELQVVSDRWGSRRLYVADLPDAFVFAADFAAVATWLGDALEVDDAYARESICLGSPLGSRTWARGIELFPPATWLAATRAAVTRRRYWTWSHLPPARERAPHWLDELQEAWTRAVGARLDGARIGQQISGGLDSRLILAEAPAGAEWPCVTYGERGSDEVMIARACARAAGKPWTWFELPDGPGWLDRRVALVLETGGTLDLVNAHHAGVLTRVASLMRVEMSGYLGDFIIGDTHDDPSPDRAVTYLAYWPSPVSLDAGEVVARVSDAVAAAGNNARAFLMDTKLRRLVNAWPHLAVNDLEVRKPFMDYRLVEVAASLPAAVRRHSVARLALLGARAPHLAGIAWQKTGVPPGAPEWRRLARRAVQRSVATAQRGLRRAGLGTRVWQRGAADVAAWLTPEIHADIAARLGAPGARVGAYFSRAQIEATLRASAARQVPVEILMNLYRLEHVLAWIAERRRTGAQAPVEHHA